MYSQPLGLTGLLPDWTSRGRCVRSAGQQLFGLWSETVPALAERRAEMDVEAVGA